MPDDLRPVLSGVDYQQLRKLVEAGGISLSSQAMLLDFLSLVIVERTQGDATGRVGLYDEVTLESEVAEGEFRKFTIVLPGERSFRDEKVSVVTEQALGVLGRSCGDKVILAAPPDLQRMRIVAVRKPL